MGHYYAIHTSIKLKPDTPKDVVDFFDMAYKQRLPRGYDEKLRSLLTAINIGPLGNTEIDCAICYGSSYHDTYRYRGKRDNLYYSFSSSKENPIDEWLGLLKNLFDYLDVKHGEIVYRWVRESDTEEELLWVDIENRKIMRADGYKYPPGYEDQGTSDDTHPSNQLRHEYPLVHYVNYFDLINNNKEAEDLDRFSFLLEVDDGYIPPV